MSWKGNEVTKNNRLVLGYWGTTCHLCGLPGADTADHVIPRSKGGDNSLMNQRPAHKVCNSRRGAQDLEEFKAQVRAGRYTHGVPLSETINDSKPSRTW